MSSHKDTPVGLLVARLYRHLLVRSAEALRPAGLTNPQLLFLKVLNDRPGISNVEIAAELMVTPQAVSAVQRTLSEAGLVEQTRNSADGRALQTRLTAKGRRLFSNYHNQMVEADQRLLEVLPAKDRERFKMLLGMLIDSHED